MCNFTLGYRSLSALFVSGLVWIAMSSPAPAQVTSDQILNALAPPVTRSLTVPQEPAISDAFGKSA